ncbi:MAG: hypothetical protein P1U32_07370 [Legionellaceae bacterium]|nr:hypothetical protein [Legionellaceae bacterium]
MSEKSQHTRAHTQATMARHYDDEFYHKHNKNHSFRRQHWPSHPSKIMGNPEHLGTIKPPTDLFRAPTKEKLLKRLAKVPFH